MIPKTDISRSNNTNILFSNIKVKYNLAESGIFWEWKLQDGVRDGVEEQNYYFWLCDFNSTLAY